MIDAELQKKLRSHFNPEGSELRKLQLRMLEMLKYIDKVCRDNNIKYWLSSGTCLGAVRHGGFIPWDDDVDIEMFPKDYFKFCKIFNNLNSIDYILQTYETDENYNLPFVKVRDLKSSIIENNKIDRWYKYRGVFIDVFPVIKSFGIISKVADLLQIVLIQKLYIINNKTLRYTLRKINLNVLYKFFFPICKTINKLSHSSILRIGGLGSGFIEKYEKDAVEDIIYMEFEGNMFPVPKAYDKYLSALYGNYMEIPFFDKLHTHITQIIYADNP